MDPLSVIASVVGILTAASKVASVLSDVKSSMFDAPQSINHALSQVNSVRIALSAIQKFLLGIDAVSRKRIAMIQVDGLVATLTETVLTFSELEALVTPFIERPGIVVRDQVKWAWKEHQVNSIMLRLDRHKSSLSLMLNIAQSESDLEAEQSRNSLHSLIQQLLKSNFEISKRMRSLEDMSESQSLLTTCFRNGRSGSLIDGEVGNMLDTPYTMAPRSWTNCPGAAFQFSFEIDLHTSRVYRRTDLYDSDVSFTTSAVRTHAWSIFSGLSLSEVSMVSAIALPIYPNDIYNSQWYPFGDPGRISLDVPNPHLESVSAMPRHNYTRPAWVDQTTSSKHSATARYKVIVMGDECVGKTALTQQFTQQHFLTLCDPTIEDFHRKQAVIDGERCVLEVVDTAGIEAYAVLQDQWIKDGQGFILVYTITSRSSFNRIVKLHNQIKLCKDQPKRARAPAISGDNPWRLPIILVGNHLDRAAEREVSTHEGQTLARDLDCSFVETSAKEYINVDKVFHDVVRQIRAQRKLAAETDEMKSTEVAARDAEEYRNTALGIKEGNTKGGFRTLWKDRRTRISLHTKRSSSPEMIRPDSSIGQNNSSKRSPSPNTIKPDIGIGQGNSSTKPSSSPETIKPDFSNGQNKPFTQRSSCLDSPKSDFSSGLDEPFAECSSSSGSTRSYFSIGRAYDNHELRCGEHIPDKDSSWISTDDDEADD